MLLIPCWNGRGYQSGLDPQYTFAEVRPGLSEDCILSLRVLALNNQFPTRQTNTT